MRLLSVGPLPPSPSGIADYTAELLPYLAEHADIAVAVADDAPTPTVRWPTRRLSELSPAVRRSYDLPIYHIGNHRLHADVVRVALEWPGLVVLHEAALHHMYADVRLSRGRGASYLREIGFEAGSTAVLAAEAVVHAEAAPAWFAHRLISRVVAAARGVIVHSNFAAAAVRHADARGAVRVCHLGAPDRSAIPADAPAAARRRRGIPPPAFLIGTFGGLTAEKRPESLVAALALLRFRGHPAHLLLAGEPGRDLSVNRMVQRHGLADCVTVTGRLPLDEMEALVAACDVVVQLRAWTAGEASAATMRALGLGRPTVVSDHGWFAELPEDAAARIPAGLGPVIEAARLAELLERLADTPTERARLSAGALSYAANATLAAAARCYVDFAADLVARGDAGRPGHFLAG